MKTRVLVALLICLLAAPADASAQRRRRITPKRSQPAAPAVDAGAETARRGAATRIADQIKTLSHYLYLLGGVVKSVESVERAARDSGGSADGDEVTERNKASIRESIRNVQLGLNQLETEFSSKPSVRPYYHLVLGVSDLGAQASQQADAGQFDQAGRLLLRALDKLTDALVAIRATP